MLIPNRYFTRIGWLAICAVALGGCSTDKLGRTFGFVRDAPDEFTVTTRAPLAMPPTFALQPPTPGVSRPQEQSEREKAEQALVPQMALGAAPAGPSPGQQALVEAAGPPASPGIRATVDQDAMLARPSRGLRGQADVLAQACPAWHRRRSAKEGQRLRENAALGQSQETGDTPIVQPKEQGWLEGTSRTATALDAAHFIQVGEAPAFAGAGGSDLICRCGQSILIKGYLPANYLAIRIKCFRCGTINVTPALAEGEILSRSAVGIERNEVRGGRARACSAWRGARVPERNNALLPADATARHTCRGGAVVARDAGGNRAGIRQAHRGAPCRARGGLAARNGSADGDYPFAWAVSRLRQRIGQPGWSWLRQDDDALAAMQVVA